MTNRDEVINITQEIFREIFDEHELVINDMMTASDIPEWGSLNHITLIHAIEKEFKIKFALGELQGLKNVGAMINLIVKKISPEICPA